MTGTWYNYYIFHTSKGREELGLANLTMHYLYELDIYDKNDGSERRVTGNIPSIVFDYFRLC